MDIQAQRERLEALVRDPPPAQPITVAELAARCVAWARETLPARPPGETHHSKNLAYAMREPTLLYPEVLARDFNLVALKACRQWLIERGLSRKVINQRISQVRYVFEWGRAKKLVPDVTVAELRLLESLEPFRTVAPERPPTQDIPDADFEAVLVVLTPQLRAMVTVQRFSLMRPGELIRLRRQDIVTDGKTWVYVPGGPETPSHKTAWKGRERKVDLGPRAVDALLPFLTPKHPEGFLFMTRAGRPWSTRTYSQAIKRACLRAGVRRWAPNRLRHTGCTKVVEARGLEAAQAVMGHARITTTQIYAHHQRKAAEAAALAMG